MSILFSTIFLLLISVVYAQERFDGEEGGGDLAQGLGSFALFLVIVGAGYIVLRRGYVYSRKFLENDIELREFVKVTYNRAKGPLLALHNILMICGTIVGIIHGLLLMNANIFSVTFGWIAAGAMIVLSVSGIIIWLRFKPIWDYRQSRTLVRFVHRQWLFTGIFVFFLLLHIAFGHD